jgi:arabinosaccharide transport system substrate-binding protein
MDVKETITRRTLLKTAAGVAAGASLFFGGCGESPAYNTGVKKTLSFWAFSDTRIAWQKKAWAMYQQEKKPDFDITWTIFPYQQMHDQVLITSQAGSGGPDIADIEISQFARFIKGDIVFEDLTPKLQAMGVLNDFYHPSATDPWSWNGKIYGIGNELNTVLMSVRWDIWQKAGVKFPIATWDEFAEEAKRYAHDHPQSYLIDFPFNDWASWWIMSLQQNGGFFNSRGLPALNSPTSIKVLQYQKQAMQDRWATVRPLSSAYYAALAAGNITSLIGPSWDFSGFIQQNTTDTSGKWHLQPLPRWTADGSRSATQGGTGVTVLKTSSSAAEGIDFVLYEHTSIPALLQDFQIRQTWPTYKPALNNPMLSQPLAFFDHQRVGDLIKEVSPEVNKWYNSPYWPEVTSAFVNYGLTPIINLNGASAEQAANEAQNQSMNVVNFETA